MHRQEGVEHDAILGGKSIFLKIDTQGYEMPVLMGAETMLNRIRGIQIELSLAPLYDGQILYREMIDWLSSKGFELYNVLPGFVD